MSSSRRRIPERNQSGGTTPSTRRIADEDILHHRGTASSRQTYYDYNDDEHEPVVAFAIPEQRDSQVSRISGSSQVSSYYNNSSSEWEQYDSKKWDNIDTMHEDTTQHSLDEGKLSSTHGSRLSANEGDPHTPLNRHTVDSYYRDNQNTRLTGPSYDRQSLTDLPGPAGTSGKTTPHKMNSNQFQDLINEGYSTGLAHALDANASRYDFRFWVVDNSGSMQIGDGHRLIVKNDGKQKAIACTRWDEIRETVKYHAQMAAVLECPTIFQLLNDPGLKTIPQRFSVCEHEDSSPHKDVTRAMEIMRKVSPTGVTPLTQHIWDIEQNISGMARELRRVGKIVAIILATDGMPTDDMGYGGEEVTDEFIRALRSLEGLPIWTVIRLCTDEEDVKDFYNSLDEQLEISIEVLDDYQGEAREVHRQNPWITYALPLQRCRELGYHDRLFDLIDERPLTMGEARKFCCFILGVSEDKLPDPAINVSAFINQVKKYLDGEQPQWNPIKKKMTPWILIKDLKKSLTDPFAVRLWDKLTGLKH